MVDEKTGVDTDRDDDDDDDDDSSSVENLAGPNGGSKGRRLAAYWQSQIKEVDDDKQQKNWLKRGLAVEKRYRDERNRTEENNERRYNALWSNVEIMLPALLGRPPVPTVERRFKDKDPAGRGAAQILERGLRNEIEINNFFESHTQALKDYLLSGRGTVWVRYEPELEEGVSIPPDNEMDLSDDRGNITEEDDSPAEEKLRETGDRVTRESVPIDYIQWTDFYTFPVQARVWGEVVAAGKRVYMTRDQLIRRFGKEVGKAIPLQKDDRGLKRREDNDKSTNYEKKAQVFEIWSRTDEMVYWVVEGYQWLCDAKEDPLKLENFFPTPRPLFANPTNNTLIPVPDYIQYQDQAIQLDELTRRIAMLTKACKVTGVYNAAASAIKRLFNESTENELLPVDDWAAFAEKGGVEGNLSFMPLKEIQTVIQELMTVKQAALAEMDRLTGITDIMRGTTDARETMGGQRLKTNSAGTRLQYRQNEVARFARDTLRIMADIMCQHFSPQSLIEVSGALYEEGLGEFDMPDLTQLQGNQPAPGQPPAGMPMTGPPAAPPQPPMVPGGPSLPQPQVPPQSNMPVPMGINASGPPLPGNMRPGPIGPPPMPPELMSKLQGIQRIIKAIQLLRDERLRGFRVEIEVDSTIYGDTQQEKGDRTAFIASVTQFLQQALMISAQVPEAAPMLGKMLQFGVRGFKVGRDLELAIEEFADQAVEVAKKAQARQASQPNPEAIKAQVAMQKGQNDMQMLKMKQQMEGSRTQAEMQHQAIENQGNMMEAQADMGQKQAEIRMREMEMQIESMRLEVEKIKAEAMVKTATLEALKPPEPPKPIVMKPPQQPAPMGGVMQ